MKYVWMQSFKSNNQLKSLLLLIGFPFFLFVIIFLVVVFAGVGDDMTFSQSWDLAFSSSGEIFLWTCIIVLIWGIISFSFEKEIMFSFAWAKEISRKEKPYVYNIVENLCISRWLPVPKIGIIDDMDMNAFATWFNINKSWIVFTKWIVENLEKEELEAVAWHELTHLINKDCQLMFIATVFVWVVSLLGEILIRINYSSKSNNEKSGSWLFILLGWWFLLLGYLVYPLLNLAISRKREFLADLGSVELTKDANAMISALEKISWRATLKKVNKRISMFFIEDPVWEDKSSLFDTHPSISERINALKSYS